MSSRCIKGRTEEQIDFLQIRTKLASIIVSAFYSTFFLISLSSLTIYGYPESLDLQCDLISCFFLCVKIFNRFLCWYTMMSKELKIGCCFSTDDKDEATDFTEKPVLLLRMSHTRQLCVRILSFQCT